MRAVSVLALLMLGCVMEQEPPPDAPARPTPGCTWPGIAKSFPEGAQHRDGQVLCVCEWAGNKEEWNCYR
jgi:hypothetical protein